MQAIVLAAGMGSRLNRMTENNTKCMIDINGEKLIDRSLESLSIAGINKVIIVVGYQSDNLKKHLLEKWKHLEIVFINNDNYMTTNNIYSLYLAYDYLFLDDTVLLESDIIFDKNMIQDLIDDSRENLAVVDKYQDWMDGTVVKLDLDKIVSFIPKNEQSIETLQTSYKTVNIYKFSKLFLSTVYAPMLKIYCESISKNKYYEEILAVFSSMSPRSLSAFNAEKYKWYEIDNINDYRIASTLFSKEEDLYDDYSQRYGGYWKFPRLIDYYYLVNPYFPTAKILSDMSFQSSNLLCSYPSGKKTINNLISDIFNIDSENILVTNGSSESIAIFSNMIKNKSVGLFYPSFDEYENRLSNCNITKINSFLISEGDLIDSMKKMSKTNDYIVLVNPENPTGKLINSELILECLPSLKENNCILILDESFIDFSAKGRNFSLLDQKILNDNDNLVIIKSISKSFGVPGVRLGIVASSNKNFIKDMSLEMPLWNINSYAEKFLELLVNNMEEYLLSCKKLEISKNKMIDELKRIGIEVYPSDANYVLVQISKRYDSKKIVNKLLQKNIFIKSLNKKQGLEDKNFFRIAVKDDESNLYFCNTLNKVLGESDE